MFLRLMFLFLWVAVSPGFCFSQEDDWTVWLTTGQALEGVSIQNVTGDSVVLVSKHNSVRVSLEEVQSIQRGRDELWTGLVVGMGIGAAVGFLAGETGAGRGLDILGSKVPVRTENTLGGLVVGGAIGTVCGALIDSEEHYDFRESTQQEKSMILQEISSRR